MMAKAVSRRDEANIVTSTNIMLVHEPEKIHGTSRQFAHTQWWPQDETDAFCPGGVPLDEHFGEQCPERIGCTNHVMEYDPACPDCEGLPIDVRKYLQRRLRLTPTHYNLRIYPTHKIVSSFFISKITRGNETHLQTKG